ncbi:MAG: hypothetical protein R3A44_27315 [Caldilineaceae bacterium]
MNGDNEYQAALDQWIAAVRQGKLDDELSLKLARLIAQHGDSDLGQLMADLAVDMDETSLPIAPQGESHAELPTDSIVAHLDFSFLSAAAEKSAIDWLEQMRRAVAQGLQWTTDSLGALCFALNFDLGSENQIAWATKAADELHPLFQSEFQIGDERDVPKWIVEVSAFAEAADELRLEVALLQPDLVEADLKDIPITVRLGDDTMTEMSDMGGVAEFTGLPVTHTGSVWVRIGVND